MIQLVWVSFVLIHSASSQSSAVLSGVSDTATFSWQISQGSLSTGSTFFAVTPGGIVMFILTSTGTFLPTDNYRDRVTFLGSRSSRNITFTMTNIQTSDAGTYTCGNGGVTDVISNCGEKLIVLGKPTTPSRPVASATPVYNQQVTLTCSSTSTTVPADHGLTLTYSWQRDGSDMTSSAGSPYTFSVESRDTQIYRCRARESQGLESEWSSVYNLMPEYGPYQTSLSPSTLSYTVTENQDTISPITCSANCSPGCNYRWFKNGTTNAGADATLSLGQAVRSKTGYYRCQPYNEHGDDYSSTVSINVDYMANINNFTANSRPGSVTLDERDSVTLTCQVDSIPASTIRIMNGSEELIKVDNSRKADYSWIVGCRQRGNYSCEAGNGIGTTGHTVVMLAVKCSPRQDDTIIPRVLYSSIVGGAVTFSLIVLAYPVPIFNWSRNSTTSQDLTGSLIPLSDVSFNISLHMTYVQLEDFGSYFLIVDNGVREKMSFTLSLVPEGPPIAPTNVTITPQGSSSVLVAWKQEYNSGSSQTFTLEYSEDKLTWHTAGTYAESKDDEYIQQIIPNLKPSTTYYVRVVARNKYGESHYTKTVSAATERETEANPQQPNTGVIVGAIVGVLAVILVVVVVIVLVRKGFRCVRLAPDTEVTRKRTSNGTDADNTAYSTADPISHGPYSDLNRVEENKQTYTELKTYVNVEPITNRDNNEITTPYEDITENRRTHYESVKASTYHNTTGQQAASPYEAV